MVIYNGIPKKTWKDRLVEYAGRRTLKRVSGDANGTMVVDVTRSEGIISQAGDDFSAANMNNLEQRIADEFTTVNSKQIDIVTRENHSLGNVQINASADASFAFDVPSKSGYKFLACLSASTSSGLVMMRGWTYNPTTNIVTVYLNNRNNAEVTVGVLIYYLMVKDS